MTTKNTSKVDGLHRYMNDVTMTIGAAVLGFAVVGILSYWEYSNRQARQQRQPCARPDRDASKRR